MEIAPTLEAFWHNPGRESPLQGTMTRPGGLWVAPQEVLGASVLMHLLRLQLWSLRNMTTLHVPGPSDLYCFHFLGFWFEVRRRQLLSFNMVNRAIGRLLHHKFILRFQNEKCVERVEERVRKD